MTSQQKSDIRILVKKWIADTMNSDCADNDKVAKVRMILRTVELANIDYILSADEIELLYHRLLCLTGVLTSGSIPTQGSVVVPTGYPIIYESPEGFDGCTGSIICYDGQIVNNYNITNLNTFIEQTDNHITNIYNGIESVSGNYVTQEVAGTQVAGQIPFWTGTTKELSRGDDTLTFVALHELTHLSINEVDHVENFWRAFKFILQESENCGIYDNIDFSFDPVYYCGITIDYSPYFDNNIIF